MRKGNSHWSIFKSTVNNEKIAYIMIAPFFIFFIIFVVAPIFTNFYYSFTNYDLYKTMDFVGLRNYRALFSDRVFIRSISNTMVYVSLSVVILLCAGLVTAVMLNRAVALMKLQRIFFFIPYITSMVAISMIWMLIFDPTLGVLNKLLSAMGISEEMWLFDPKIALFCLVAINIWRNLGYVMTIYLAGLQMIPSDFYEAADIDGATGLRKFFTITIPLLAPTTFFLLVINCIEGFKAFEQINIMTGGGPANATTTIVHQIYITGFHQNKMGYAAAMSMVLFLIVLVVTIINFAFGNRSNEY